MGGGITNLKRNAFTLIELLAIIVILAIIAVITVPIILNIIENSRKGAATDSAYGYKDSVNKFYIAELQNHNKLKLDGTYIVNSDGSLEPTTDNTFGFGDSEYGDSLDVAVSGTIPSNGKLRYSNNVLNAGCVVIGDYKVTFGTDGKVNETVKGDCIDYEFAEEEEEIVFTSFTGKVQGADEYFFNLSSLPDNAAFWIQKNDVISQGCAHDFNTGKDICFDSFKWDCGTPSLDQNNKLICSQDGYVSKKINKIQQMGFQCGSWDNNSLYCDTLNLSGDGVAISADGSVQTSDTVGWRCDIVEDGTIDCN